MAEAERASTSSNRSFGGNGGHRRFAAHVGYGLVAAGGLLLVASLVDLGVLWLAQRQPTLQWEYIATTRSLEALPRLALGIGVLYGAVYFLRIQSVVAYRLLAAGLLGLGLVGATLGTLVLLNYLSLRGSITGDALPVFESTTVKSLILAATYMLVLFPAGVLGLRRPKG